MKVPKRLRRAIAVALAVLAVAAGFAVFNAAAQADEPPVVNHNNNPTEDDDWG
ncbi:MAG: hypothetical protein ACRDXX_04260 [Stackebrandtia sp.]